MRSLRSAEVFVSCVGGDVGAVEHVGQNFLCVLQPFGHLCVLAIKGSGKRILASLSFQVDVSHQLLFTWKNNFSLVGKVHLNNFVAESEHDCVLGLHPFLDIAVSAFWGSILVKIDFVVCVKIVPEMLKKSHFFLELSFSWVLTNLVGGNCVSFVSWLFLNVLKIFSIFVNNDLGWVIEVDSCWSIWKQVSQAVFGRVVDPFFHMDFRVDNSFF